MNHYIKRILVYTLCFAQAFPLHSVMAMSPSAYHMVDALDPMGISHKVCSLDRINGSYNLDFGQFESELEESLYFRDKKTGKWLGGLQHTKKDLQVSWEEGILIFDASSSTSAKELIIHSNESVHYAGTRLNQPTSIEAPSIEFSKDVEAAANCYLKAENECRLKSFQSHFDLTIQSQVFSNQKGCRLRARKMQIESLRGENRGTFLGNNIALVGAWDNWGMISAMRLSLGGASFIGWEESCTFGHARFEVDFEDKPSLKREFTDQKDFGAYRMYGESRSFFQTIKAPKTRFKGKTRFFGGYLNIIADSIEFSQDSNMAVLGGMRMRSKKSLLLQGAFDIDGSSSTLPCFLKHSFNWDVEELDGFAGLYAEARDTVPLGMNVKTKGDLVQRSHIRLFKKNVFFAGPTVKVEGKIIADSPDSTLDVVSHKSTINSRILPKRLVLKGADKFIRRCPNLDFLLSKAMKTSASSVVRIKPKGPLEIVEWESIGEKIYSFGDLGVKHLTLMSPQKVGLQQLRTDQITVKDAVETLYIGSLFLTKVAEILSEEGEVFVGSLHGPGAECSIHSGRVHILNGSALEKLEVQAQEAAYLMDIDAKTMEATVVDGTFRGKSLRYEDATLIGGSVETSGQFKGKEGGKGVNIISTKGDVRQSATISGKAVIEAVEGRDVVVTKKGGFESGSELSIKTHFADRFYGGSADLKSLHLTAHKLFDAKDWLEGKRGWSAESLRLEQSSDRPLYLTGRVHVAFPDVKVLAAGFLSTRGSDITSNGDVGFISGGNMDTGDSRVQIAGEYSREVGGFLNAVHEYVHAMSILANAKTADFSFAREEAHRIYLKIEGALKAQGVYMNASKEFREEGSDTVPSLEVFSGSMDAAAKTERRGNWSHEFDVLVARPKFLCEGGLLSIVAENGIWMQVPIVKGDDATIESRHGDVRIDALKLKDIKRWHNVETKGGRWNRPSKTTVTEGYSLTETHVTPDIESTGDLKIFAKEGEITLGAAKVIVAKDWTVISKKFGAEAATNLKIAYESIRFSKSSGLRHGTKKSGTIFSHQEETVPPIIVVHGKLYIYCEEARFESLHGFINELVNGSGQLKIDAHDVHSRVEQHNSLKTPAAKMESGLVHEFYDQTPSSVQINTWTQLDPDGLIKIVGDDVNIDTLKGTPNIIYEKIKSHEIFTSYAHAKSRNQGLLEFATLSASIAAGYGGAQLATTVMQKAVFSALAAKFASELTQTVLVSKRVKVEKLARDLAASAFVAAATAGALEAAGLSGKPDTFLDRVKISSVENAVRGVFEVVQGESFRDVLKRSGIKVAVDASTGSLAQVAGEQYGEKEINYVVHKSAHAALGAMRGMLLSPGDKKRAATSGAFGAAFAEILAEELSPKIQSIVEQKRQDLGRRPTSEEIGDAVAAQGEKIILSARLISAGIAALTGMDVNISDSAATNALINNFSRELMRQTAEFLLEPDIEGALSIEDTPRDIWLKSLNRRENGGLFSSYEGMVGEPALEPRSFLQHYADASDDSFERLMDDHFIHGVNTLMRPGAMYVGDQMRLGVNYTGNQIRLYKNWALENPYSALVAEGVVGGFILVYSAPIALPELGLTVIMKIGDALGTFDGPKRLLSCGVGKVLSLTGADAQNVDALSGVVGNQLFSKATNPQALFKQRKPFIAPMEFGTQTITIFDVKQSVGTYKLTPMHPSSSMNAYKLRRHYQQLEIAGNNPYAGAFEISGSSKGMVQHLLYKEYLNLNKTM